MIFVKNCNNKRIVISLILLYRFYHCIKSGTKENFVKKILVSILLGFFAAAFSLGALAQDTIETISDNASFYYSPSSNTWSRTAKASDSIKVTKHGTKFTTEKNGDFTLKSDYAFISKNQFASVDNVNLKVYTAVYSGEKFTPKEMDGKMVQAMFNDIKVIAVSEMKNNSTLIKRTPFTTETAMIVNDTNTDFSDYIFSPTSIQRSPIRGMFLVRQVGRVKFMKKGDVQRQYPYLQFIIRNDVEKYNNQPLYIQRPVLNYQYKTN